eukprot:TRINITY_DN92676_c0_g1_i1.p1 TRINITY_DN92676_c0_g1~~TRINITY_DN92676_c0_g1_i1.p1  ORF type:complete len:304 (-),score=44.85 TRINITY_DN92676_c0_g1_i1:18-881(-)
MEACDAPPPVAARGGFGSIHASQRCTAQEFWLLFDDRLASRPYAVPQRVLQSALPPPAASAVAAFLHDKIAPDCTEDLWGKVYSMLDHKQERFVRRQFGVYLRRFRDEANKIFPDMVMEDLPHREDVDFGSYSPPLKICKAIYFYRLHYVKFGGMTLCFVADVLGQLTNGQFFYYKEGLPAQAPGCCTCAGISRCEQYQVIVAESLEAVVEGMSPEDRHDVGIGRAKPRLYRCSCRECRKRAASRRRSIPASTGSAAIISSSTPQPDSAIDTPADLQLEAFAEMLTG